jgi:heterodisulfide reductase subunit C
MLNNNKNICKDINCPIQGVPANAVSIVESVSKEECALALLIEAQADLLCKAINKCISVCDFKDIINSIIQTMKTIAIKNNTLENKLRETLNFIQKEGIECLDYNRQFELLNSLNSVLECISKEEDATGHLIEQTGKIIAKVEYCTLDDIKSVDDSVLTLMRLIIENNFILDRKLRTLISLINFIKCSEFDIFIKVKKKLLCTIKKLINSIFAEEKGLALLIHGESEKLHCGLSVCVNRDEISEISNFISKIIDVICEKKRILEYKFSETIDLLNTVGFSSSETDSVTDHIKELQSYALAGEYELANLIKGKSKNINATIGKECCNYQEIISFNACMTCSLVCLLLNLNVGRKNRKVIDSCPSGCKNASMCKEINNIIMKLNSL